MLTIKCLAPALLAAGLFGCDGTALTPADTGSSSQAITDVEHTPVERQSIGNCWIYAQATWVESLNLSATGTELDVSQSYWTYWHWYDQLTGFFTPDEIQTGGFQFKSHQIVRERGVMPEASFVFADTESEMSSRQAAALDAVNLALANGDFENADGEKVRQLLDDAWELPPEVRAQLDQAFGADGAQTLRRGGSVAGTDILDPAAIKVRYTSRQSGATEVRDATLLDAIAEWNDVSYPFDASGRRAFLQRVQRALHDRQPVVITWDVDFNALENNAGDLQGSFNMTTLKAAGDAGHQGGHMTVLEDYAAETVEFGLLEAGKTLDPADPDDARKLEAALRDDTEVKLLRIKNSWGANRPDREFAPGFPGYHDLYLDYLNGPIAWCPDREPGEDCTGESTPLDKVMLPPGY